jgi:hypothetical protein
MKNLQKTQRSYTEFWSGKIFAMYQNPDTHQNVLINEWTDEKIENFIYAAFTAITYKFWDKSEISLSVGQFLKIDKFNPPIAKKLTGIQKRFVKY